MPFLNQNGGGSGSSGGATVPTTHNQLAGRSSADAHPVSAITDLQGYLAKLGANVGVLVPATPLGNYEVTTELISDIVTEIDGVTIADNELYIAGDHTTYYYSGDYAAVNYTNNGGGYHTFTIQTVSYQYIDETEYTKLTFDQIYSGYSFVSVYPYQQWWGYSDPREGGDWQTALTNYALQTLGTSALADFTRVVNSWDGILWVYIGGVWYNTVNSALAAAWGDSAKSGSVEISENGYFYVDTTADNNKTTVYQKMADMDMSLMVENYPEYNQTRLAQRQFSKYGQILEQLVDISGDYQNVYTKNGGTSYENIARASSSPYGSGVNAEAEFNNLVQSYREDVSMIQMPEVPADGDKEAYTPTAKVSVRRRAERSETDELSAAFEVVLELTDPATGEQTTRTLHFDSGGNFTWDGAAILTEAPNDGKLYGRQNGAWVEINF